MEDENLEKPKMHEVIDEVDQPPKRARGRPKNPPKKERTPAQKANDERQRKRFQELAAMKKGDKMIEEPTPVSRKKPPKKTPVKPVEMESDESDQSSVEVRYIKREKPKQKRKKKVYIQQQESSSSEEEVYVKPSRRNQPIPQYNEPPPFNYV